MIYINYNYIHPYAAIEYMYMYIIIELQLSQRNAPKSYTKKYVLDINIDACIYFYWPFNEHDDFENNYYKYML